MPNVKYVLPELTAILPQYQMIKDCVAGAMTIKKKGQIYLPNPQPLDESPENVQRYKDYVLRAMFYNVTRRTLNGLTGQVYSRPPEIKLPSSLSVIEKNANGAGVGIVQLSKQVTRSVLSLGRSGIHTDFPDTGETGVSQEQMASGRYTPTLNFYDPTEIINWRVETFGSEDLLTLVVLKEVYTKKDDGFEMEKGEQYRVLRLVDRTYVVEIYRDTDYSRPVSRVMPTKSDGTPFDRIPFTFVGIDNNDPEIDEPPLFDMADLNIAHYRNSADMEEMLFMIGQATPWISGLDREWVEDVLGGTVYLGSRGAIPLPEGAQAGLLQLQETSQLATEMEHKERRMVALGARLVEQNTVQRTAQEARMEASNESSTLISAAENVSSAFEMALGWAAEFTGDAGGTIAYQLNREYELNNMSAEEIRQLISSWQSEAISWTEMRTRLRYAGYATMDDDKAREEIQNDATAHSEQMREQVQADIEAGITPPPNPEE